MITTNNVHWLDADTVMYQTNCLYQDHGQVIIARWHDGDKVTFVDVSRGVYGLMEGVKHTSLSTYPVNDIQHRYLYNEYSYDVDWELRRELEKLAVENMDQVPLTRKD